MKLPEHLTAESTIDNGIFVRVFVDGVEVDDVLEAHTGEGWAIACKLNDAGEIYMDGDEVATERLTGTVTAEIKPTA